MQRNDGGPAYPMQFQDVSGAKGWLQSEGMTLRDAAALAILQGICANPTWDENGWADRARAACEGADAFLAARDGGDNAA